MIKVSETVQRTYNYGRNYFVRRLHYAAGEVRTPRSGATHSISPCIAKLRVNENSVIFRETRNRWFIRIEKVLNPNGSPPRATPDLTPLLSSPAPGREKDEPSGQVTVKWFIKVRTFYLEPSASERQNGAPTGRLNARTP